MTTSILSLLVFGQESIRHSFRPVGSLCPTPLPTSVVCRPVRVAPGAWQPPKRRVFRPREEDLGLQWTWSCRWAGSYLCTGAQDGGGGSEKHPKERLACPHRAVLIPAPAAGLCSNTGLGKKEAGPDHLGSEPQGPTCSKPHCSLLFSPPGLEFTLRAISGPFIITTVCVYYLICISLTHVRQVILFPLLRDRYVD